VSHADEFAGTSHSLSPSVTLLRIRREIHKFRQCRRDRHMMIILAKLDHPDVMADFQRARR